MALPEHRRRANAPRIDSSDVLILPDGGIGEETAELLEDLVIHPHGQGTLSGAQEAQDPRPWWKRPSPYWLICILGFTSAAVGATIAPRVEIYTMLACQVHKPDIFRENYPLPQIPIHPPIFLPQTSAIDSRSSPSHVFWETPATPSSDPAKRNLCAKDPVVQAAVARLSAIITTTIGVLSCITTGWWGAFSDRHGRTRVMFLGVTGALLTDLTIITVTLNIKRVPGGYWFLVIGAMFEGMLGGIATGTAAVHAYIADTSSEGDRSRMLSLSLGVIFTGMALGPSAGSLVIRYTKDTLSVFFVVSALHAFYALFSIFVIPESVTAEQKKDAKVRYREELQLSAEAREGVERGLVFVLFWFKRLFSFLSPLTLFTPKRIDPFKKGSPRDWSLTFLVIAYGTVLMTSGSYTYKFQYAAAAFGWSSQTLGYWLSLVGAARAILLTVLLPLILKFFKPGPVVIEVVDEQSPEGSEATPLLQRKTVRKEIHSPAFDFGLARVSLFIELIIATAMALSVSALTFTIFGMLGALGVAFGPATQSVTLALYSRRGGKDVGRLFGALSVVQALSSQIAGPALYGFIYMKTVASFPTTIFYVSAIMFGCSLLLFSFIRLPVDAMFAPGADQTIADDTQPEAEYGTIPRT